MAAEESPSAGHARSYVKHVANAKCGLCISLASSLNLRLSFPAALRLVLLVSSTPGCKARFRTLVGHNSPKPARNQVNEASHSKTEPSIQDVIDVDVTFWHPELGELQDGNQHHNRSDSGNLLPIHNTPTHQQEKRRDAKKPKRQLVPKGIKCVEENSHVFRSYRLGNFGIRFERKEKNDAQASDK
jgi:hypothetical protein